MFTPEYFINLVQETKKQIVTLYVPNKEIRNEIIDLIEAQSEYAKSVAKNITSVSQLMLKNFAVAK